jgi:hypothetical protein
MVGELVTVDQAARLTHRSTEAMRKLVLRHGVPVIYTTSGRARVRVSLQDVLRVVERVEQRVR